MGWGFPFKTKEVLNLARLSGWKYCDFTNDHWISLENTWYDDVQLSVKSFKNLSAPGIWVKRKGNECGGEKWAS